MNKTLTPILGLIILITLVNWSSETSDGGKRDLKVNFYGTLKTRSGEQFEVDNISIEWLYKEIPLYETPDNQEKLKPDHVLSKNPLKGIITRIDLSEVYAIRVPAPDITWTYQKEKGYRNTEYVEIAVVFEDQKTTHNYLININRKLRCRETNSVGPIEKEVPFQAVNELIIKGHRARDREEEKACKKEIKTLAQASSRREAMADRSHKATPRHAKNKQKHKSETQATHA